MVKKYLQKLIRIKLKRYNIIIKAYIDTDSNKVKIDNILTT